MVIIFFQAEDGIRDLTVTGVQTCALPIYLFVLVGGQRRHQLAVDVALHRACELRPSMAARIDAEEPRRREVEPVADPSAEESSRQKAAHESADERFAHPRTARIDTPDPPKRTAVISARIPSAVSSAPRPP